MTFQTYLFQFGISYTRSIFAHHGHDNIFRDAARLIACLMHIVTLDLFNGQVETITPFVDVDVVVPVLRLFGAEI